MEEVDSSPDNADSIISVTRCCCRLHVLFLAGILCMTIQEAVCAMFNRKARSHRQNFAGAFLERYEEGPNFGNARHRAQNGEKKSKTRALPKRCTAEASVGLALV
ncbi:hypothetical protein DPMN_088334 [Dreissena polymorpha]|uniref:Uncharacterized protein n=1 Tax=Dreissena polymorpha TaxID=45954 RepID=A0A9D4KUD4_DREPO|nr:hypothetical protein DPMN_088334 [Dreissena polymorpha]